jgi:hypothetical protein
MKELCGMVSADGSLGRKPDKLTILTQAVAHMQSLRGKAAYSTQLGILATLY